MILNHIINLQSYRFDEIKNTSRISILMLISKKVIILGYLIKVKPIIYK